MSSTTSNVVSETAVVEFRDFAVGFRDFNFGFRDINVGVRDLKLGFRDNTLTFGDVKSEFGAECCAIDSVCDRTNLCMHVDMWLASCRRIECTVVIGGENRRRVDDVCVCVCV